MITRSTRVKDPVVHVGGLRKHEKTQHALTGLGRAALEARIARKGEKENKMY